MTPDMKNFIVCSLFFFFLKLKIIIKKKNSFTARFNIINDIINSNEFVKLNIPCRDIIIMDNCMVECVSELFLTLNTYNKRNQQLDYCAHKKDIFNLIESVLIQQRNYWYQQLNDYFY